MNGLPFSLRFSDEPTKTQEILATDRARLQSLSIPFWQALHLPG